MHYNKLKDYAYDHILEQITNGIFLPGERITEKQLEEEMGLSRTPIREAFIELAGEGILIAEPRKGYRVNAHTIKRTEDLYELMGLLEGFLAYKVTDLLTEADYQEMDDIIQKIDITIDSGDVKAYYIIHHQFDYCFAKHCPNEELRNDVDRLRKLFAWRYLPLDRNPIYRQAIKTTNEQHREILKLFKDHDKKGVQEYFQYVHWSKESVVFKVINSLVLGPRAEISS